MDKTLSKNELECETYKQKYNALLKQHLKLESRIEKILKISDKNSLKFIEEMKELEKTSHRCEIIIKHSDRQGRKTLDEKKSIEKALEYELAINCEQEKLLKEKSKLAAMGEMIENIAHQFKQPLASINTIATGLQLKKELNDLSDDEFNDLTLKLCETVEYLNNTISDFRNFFQNDKEKEVFKIEYVIKKCLDLLIYRINLQNVKVQLDVNNLEYFGCKNELIQVLMNLIVNSLDAIKEKQINNPWINISAFVDKNKNYLNLIIKDNAMGINEKILENIFKARFTTKEKENGSGIGLYMSKKIIKEHFYGDIIVKNHTLINEKGAEFTIVLPLN